MKSGYITFDCGMHVTFKNGMIIDVVHPPNEDFSECEDSSQSVDSSNDINYYVILCSPWSCCCIFENIYRDEIFCSGNLENARQYMNDYRSSLELYHNSSLNETMLSVYSHDGKDAILKEKYYFDYDSETSSSYDYPF